MAALYNKAIDRLGLVVTEHYCKISFDDGYNVPTIYLTVSVEELRDLRYLLDRAIAAADKFAAH